MQKHTKPLNSTSKTFNWLEYWRQKSLLSQEHEKAAWGSPESQTNRFKAVGRKLLSYRPSVVLDVGCGTGEFERWYKQEIGNTVHFVGVDLIPYNIEQARKKQLRRCYFQVADATKLPFKTANFPITIMIGVLQNCSRPYEVLREVSRVTERRMLLTTLSSHAKRKNPVNTYFSSHDLIPFLWYVGWKTVQEYGIDTKTGQLVPPETTHVMMLECSR